MSGVSSRTDRTAEVLAGYETNPLIRVFHQPVNRGKGAALRTGFTSATGDIVVIQDADLEYDPNDIKLLLGPVLGGHADVVYGSRFLGGGPHRVVYYWHYLGNRFLTTLSNMMTDLCSLPATSQRPGGGDSSQNDYVGTRRTQTQRSDVVVC